MSAYSKHCFFSEKKTNNSMTVTCFLLCSCVCIHMLFPLRIHQTLKSMQYCSAVCYQSLCFFYLGPFSITCMCNLWSCIGLNMYISKVNKSLRRRRKKSPVCYDCCCSPCLLSVCLAFNNTYSGICQSVVPFLRHSLALSVPFQREETMWMNVSRHLIQDAEVWLQIPVKV